MELLGRTAEQSFAKESHMALRKIVRGSKKPAAPTRKPGKKIPVRAGRKSTKGVGRGGGRKATRGKKTASGR